MILDDQMIRYRVLVGGVGGNRLLLMAPEPVSWELWSDVVANLRNVNGACLELVDKANKPGFSLAQRAKQDSAGGEMYIYSSSPGHRVDVEPMWSVETVKKMKMGAPVAGQAVEDG